MVLEIITPKRKVYSETIELIQLPGADGSFEILDRHAPIIATLTAGRVKVININKQKIYFDISKGLVEAKKNKIVLLVDDASLFEKKTNL